jgi:DNA-binding NtrC family response regulator
VLLANYPFPGNVRELRMMVTDAVLRHKGGVLSMESFRKATGMEGTSAGPTDGAGAAGEQGSSPFLPSSRLPTLKEAEEYLIATALARSRNNQGIAASLLGITRQALNKRLVRGSKGARDVGDAEGS